MKKSCFFGVLLSLSSFAFGQNLPTVFHSQVKGVSGPVEVSVSSLDLDTSGYFAVQPDVIATQIYKIESPDKFWISATSMASMSEQMLLASLVTQMSYPRASRCDTRPFTKEYMLVSTWFWRASLSELGERAAALQGLFQSILPGADFGVDRPLYTQTCSYRDELGYSQSFTSFAFFIDATPTKAPDTEAYLVVWSQGASRD